MNINRDASSIQKPTICLIATCKKVNQGDTSAQSKLADARSSFAKQGEIVMGVAQELYGKKQ